MTPYSKIYDAFLSRVTDDDWDEWLLEEAQEDWRQILESALPWFKYPRVSSEHNDEGFVDDLNY